MDVKVSRKEKRMYKDGPVEVFVDNCFDLYPISSADDENLIVDVEMLDGARDELLDRALFATVKQRGQDPLAPLDGIQWSEALMGEIIPPVIVKQVEDAVRAEGPGVKVSYETVTNKGKEYLTYKLTLSNAV